jgi:hypothetical protein
MSEQVDARFWMLGFVLKQSLDGQRKAIGIAVLD